MERTRLELQAFLEHLIGSRNVYFQPPASIRMNYPAIVYELEDIRNFPANNSPYLQGTAYRLMVIDDDPDSEISKVVSKLPTCRFNRFYTADDLNHFIFTFYY